MLHPPFHMVLYIFVWLAVSSWVCGLLEERLVHCELEALKIGTRYATHSCASSHLCNIPFPLPRTLGLQIFTTVRLKTKNGTYGFTKRLSWNTWVSPHGWRMGSTNQVDGLQRGYLPLLFESVVVGLVDRMRQKVHTGL